MALLDFHSIGNPYINVIPRDSSSPRVLMLFCSTLRHQASGLKGDLVTLTETNFNQMAVISRRLKVKWALNYQNNSPIKKKSGYE